jgi:co-chaperonin GroES (HSP10)
MTTETISSNSTEVPKTKLALEEKYKSENQELKKEDDKRVDETNVESIADELPEPSGYRLLVLPFTPKEKTKGGIIIAQESLDKLRIATNCGYVIKLGPLAYADKEKFATGPWCKKGDWVIFARYAGSRLPIEGGEVRILNDDEVLGTIKDPESVLHHI